MTLTASARLAGIAYLLYIAIAMPCMTLFAAATRGRTMAEKLAAVGANASDLRISIVLSLLTCFAAFALATGLYGITRGTSHELALLALSCRVGEGVINAVNTGAMVGILWLGTSVSSSTPHDPAAVQLVTALLVKMSDWLTTISATCFGVGSVIFSALLYRGRVVPRPLASLGVIASIAVTIVLPLQLVGAITGGMGWPVWLPMLVFEIVLGIWLLIKGADSPGTNPPTASQTRIQ